MKAEFKMKTEQTDQQTVWPYSVTRNDSTLYCQTVAEQIINRGQSAITTQYTMLKINKE